MNRNVESHFAQAPAGVNIQRSQFDMSHDYLTSFNVGECIPTLCHEVLPGDTFKITTSKVVRLQTLLKPIFGNIYLDTYFFFVPMRLIWTHTKQFFGESEQAWTPSVEYTIPQVRVPTNGFGYGSLADYLGVSPEIKNPNGDVTVNALPFRGYALIMNEWFRDQNLTDPLVIPTGDATEQGNSKTDSDLYSAYGGPLFRACKYHDRFTSSAPAPQNGPTTILPLGDNAPVYTGPVNSGAYNKAAIQFRRFDGSDITTGVHQATFYNPGDLNGNAGLTVQTSTSGSATGTYVMPVNLYADLSNATATTINDLRLAFQIQKFYEREVYGRRYSEAIRSHFGVTSPDARMQRPEYLGGNRIPLNIHEITNNSEGENAFLGNLGAMSHTSDIHEDMIYSSTEHGYLYCITVARYSHSYQGLGKMWSRKSMFDFFWPEFSNIGNTPILKKEIFATGGETDDQVFGYNEAWSEYRFAEDTCTAEMRPSHPQTLASWNLADDYETAPSLSDSWIREDKTNLDRCLAVTSAVSNQIFADIYFKEIATRPMPMFSIPGLIDHN